MKFSETPLKGAWIIEPQIYKDERGYFYESFIQKEFINNVGNVDFIQENQSCSKYGVLRGLHFQKAPYTQAKLVRVVKGEVLDVIVDLREDSKTYLKYYAVKLSESNHLQLYAPRNFAHGYLVLSNEAVFQYKVDNYYAPSHEDGIRFDDPIIGVDWGIEEKFMILAEKDTQLPYVINGK